jgi:ABC-type uncharacterized transport system auxiliary subunit
VRRRIGARTLATNIAAVALCAVQAGCFRGTLPPREFYRLTPVDSIPMTAAPAGAPPLSRSVAIMPYDTPGIYGDEALVYRVGATGYGKYPSREWAIPLADMLATRTETIVGARALTSGRVAFDRSAVRPGEYEWRGVVREFDEVDGPASVSASVSLAARLVRVADDSVVWSGAAHEEEAVAESRNIDSVVAALSVATSRALTRLVDDAAATLRRVAAARAQGR